MDDHDRSDLVCLYLDGYTGLRDRSPVPRALTAAGIGDALEVGDTAASRVDLLGDLRKLQESGLVTSEERSVEGFEHPRTAYFLTKAGRRKARGIRERVSGTSVKVTNGTSVEVPIDEIDRYFEDSDAPVVTALARMTDDRQVPLDRHVAEEFVGRGEELATVREAIAASFTRDPRTVVVGGAAGMGKTALVREAIERVRGDHEDLVVAKGANPPGAADPYVPFRQAFEALPNGDGLLARMNEARSAVSPDDPEMLTARRRALFEDVADGLRDAATDRPVVVFLDNLQWADEATLELFAHLATNVDGWVYPVAFVGTYRAPTVTAIDGHPLPGVLQRIDDESAFEDVILEPLSRADTRALLAEVLGHRRPPKGFVELVYDRTGGNPLFVRETATHLLETDQVDPTADRYPTDPESVKLPAEVTEQIDRRLRALDDPSRELLRLGAVLGERVPGEVLAAASDLLPADHREYVDVLVASRIWETVEDTTPGSDNGSSRGDGTSDLKFVSGGLREAVVDRLSADRAREYHRRVAEAFVDVYGEECAGRAARVAHHFEEASDHRAAVEYYRRAGDHARSSYAHRDAIENYNQALRLGRKHGADGDTLAGTLGDVAEVYDATGEYDEAVAAAREGRETADDRSRVRCRLFGIEASALINRSDFETAEETAREQRELAADIGARDLEAEARYRLGTVARSRGEYETAREHVEASLNIWRESDDRRRVAQCIVELGVLAYFTGDYDRAERRYERGLDMFRSLDDRDGEADVLNNLGVLVHRRDEYERARGYHEESLAINREVGDPRGEMHSLVNLGTIAQREDDYEGAREHYEGSLEIAREIGDRKGEANCLILTAKDTCTWSHLSLYGEPGKRLC